MKILKAVITAAGRNQRSLPLQTLVDRDGRQKTVLSILVEEARGAGIEEIAVIISPGDERIYREAAGDLLAGSLRFIPQDHPLGYGDAIYRARDFVGENSFLHLVGDHIYVSGNKRMCAQQLVEVAAAQSCSVSGVQRTKESFLPVFGAVGGSRMQGSPDLYLVEKVIEKPTPTEAEQMLLIPGLRSGFYLCFFGMHVLTPTVMDLLAKEVRNSNLHRRIELSPILSALAERERYLAFETQGRRYPIDVQYGLLTAQLALALSGRDREMVLTELCELLAHQMLDHQTQESAS